MEVCRSDDMNENYWNSFVTYEGALASLAEETDTEAAGGWCHHLVPVPENLQPGQGAAVL